MWKLLIFQRVWCCWINKRFKVSKPEISHPVWFNNAPYLNHNFKGILMIFTIIPPGMQKSPYKENQHRNWNKQVCKTFGEICLRKINYLVYLLKHLYEFSVYLIVDMISLSWIPALHRFNLVTMFYAQCWKLIVRPNKLCHYKIKLLNYNVCSVVTRLRSYRFAIVILCPTHGGMREVHFAKDAFIENDSIQ